MDLFSHPSLALALAMAFGVLTQAIARHLYVPGIVLLLAIGALLGPDGANIVRPEALGDGLSAVVGFGVAVILFEGGLRLELRVLRRQAVAIRRLVTFGAIITAAGGTIACRAFMGWDWRLCLLFGTLVIVTGPTVVTPLVRRIGLHRDIGSILEAEGIFIDAIGATIAVVALEFAIAPAQAHLGEAALGISLRLGVGGGIGLVGGVLLALLLRWRRVVPGGIENVLALAVAIALFELSNALVPESGITAAIVAGVILGNVGSYAFEQLADFKEQLTVLLIATLFLLLAADVRLTEVYALGAAGVGTVLALMFVVRPLTVFACTLGTGLSLRHKLFISWCAPRGIIAAAVASLFAIELAHVGIEGGGALRALVFLVIAITVTTQGLTSGFVAQVLGVRSARDFGYIMLGANPLSLYLAGRLEPSGGPVVIIDSSEDAANAARASDYEVLIANGLDPQTLAEARVATRRACIGLTATESVNLLFARHVVDEAKGPAVYVAIDADSPGVTTDMAEKIDARILFGGARGVHGWILRWQRGRIEVARYIYAPKTEAYGGDFFTAPRGTFLPLTWERGGALELVDETLRLRAGDIVEFAINVDARSRADNWFDANGWRRIT